MRFVEISPHFALYQEKSRKVRAMKSSGIGGQAVIEGIMMKNQDVYSIAVRRPDGEIDVHLSTYDSIAGQGKLRKIPIIRGVVNFVDSLVLGMRCLTHSAKFYDDEDMESSRADDLMQKVFKDKAENVVMGITVTFSIVMAVAIFMVLPYFVADYLRVYIVSDTVLAILEGAIRLLLFLLYVVLISQMRDIRRVFQYHGAEHKCINCIENGWELNTKNVRKASKHHKRCGTSFMLVVMVISIIFFIFIRVDSPILRVVLRIALVPVIAGVSYEFIRFAGNTSNPIMSILSRPGMWLQALTTREPDRKMMEVGIAAVEAVFDWRAYQEEQGIYHERSQDDLDAYVDALPETGLAATSLEEAEEGKEQLDISPAPEKDKEENPKSDETLEEELETVQDIEKILEMPETPKASKGQRKPAGKKAEEVPEENLDIPVVQEWKTEKARGTEKQSARRQADKKAEETKTPKMAKRKAPSKAKREETEKAQEVPSDILDILEETDKS